MTWVFLVLGLIIGWLLYLLADTFFWRDRRVCTDLERDLQNSVAELEGKNVALNSRIGELDVEAGKVPALQAALDARGAELDGLNASLNAKDAEIDGYNVRVGELETANGSLNAQIGDLEASLAARDAELGGLRGQIGGLEADLNGRDGQIAGLNAELGDLNVQLGDRDSEIARLNGQVGSVDSELKGWGLGALATGGLMALRERFLGMKEDLSAKETELGSMQLSAEDTTLQLGALSADVESRDVTIGDLNAQIGGLTADVEARDAEIAGLNLALEGKDAEINGLNVELGDLRGQLADVDSELSGLNIDADAGMTAAGAGLGLAGLIGWLRGRKDSLETDVADRDSQLVALNAQVETDRVGLEQQIGGLSANLEAKDAEIGDLNAQLASLRADLNGRDVQIGGLNADMEARDAQIGGLNVALDGKNAEIDGLNVELGDLRGQLADVDNELSGLNIDADTGVAVAGTGLGLAGLIGWLRSRKDSLETDVADRDGQLVALNAQVETDRVGYEQRIGGLNVDLEAKEAEIAALNARVGELDAELVASAEKHSVEVDGCLSDLLERENEINLLRGELASVQGELDGLTIDASGGSSGDADVNVAAMAGGGLGLAGLVAWLRGRKDSLETDVVDRDSQIVALNAKAETDAQTFEVERGQYGQRIVDLEAMLAERDVTIGTLQASMPPDDLTRVWGIGPKIAAALNAAGIKSYAQLAETEDDRITEILEASGVNYRLAGPAVRATWQEQAELLAAGELDELKLRQAQFKRSGGGLGKVWGIGSKVSGLLTAVGVTNYTELATSRTADISDALHAAKGYYPGMSNAEIHQSWVQQASMASNSQWTPLKNYQARFRRGRAAAAKPDDLKRIWGIGPKIEEVLNNSGITTFTRLAETSVAEIERILNESGSRFNMTSSDTLLANWTTQARLASVGNWDAFQELYDKLTWDNVQDED